MEEIWKKIPGVDEKYVASSNGRIKNIKTGIIISGAVDPSGYIIVSLSRKSYRKHVLIAKTFIPNADNLPQVNHIDENKTNNAVKNLEWCTSKYNINYGTSLIRRAKSQSRAVEMIDKGGNLVKRHYGLSEAARFVNRSAGDIWRCCNGQQRTCAGYQWQYV